MYAINPVNIPLIGQVDTLTIEVLKFPMKPGKSYSVETYVTLRGGKFYEDNILVPAAVVEAWGDDQVIVDYVISQLNAALGQDLIVLAPEVAEEPAEETPTEEAPAEEPTEPAA
jgi:hypothetical protein